MMGWVFAGITLAAALLATFVTRLKQAILALWVAGLGVGAIYLTLGAEFLAIIQCVVSTLVTISFIFFSVMFGDYQPVKREKAGGQAFLVVLSILVGGMFAAVIFLAAQGLPMGLVDGVTDLAAVEGTHADLAELGLALTQKNLLALEVLGLTLFLVLVGGGAVARFERSDQF